MALNTINITQKSGQYRGWGHGTCSVYLLKSVILLQSTQIWYE